MVGELQRKAPRRTDTSCVRGTVCGAVGRRANARDARLNPGPPDFAFQARDGFFAKQIRESSYREWAESDPYGSELWETRNTVNPSRRSGRKTNIYRAARLRFARDWLDDQTIDNRDLLTVELYPWHSWQVSGTIRPPDAVLDEFVWKPLGEIGVDTAFAFGKPWLDVCQRLGLAQGESWMEGRFHVASRAAVMFRLPHGPQRLVVLWQSGYAGPPGPADTERLRELVGGLGALEAA